jgi:hypothetical protein
MLISLPVGAVMNHQQSTGGMGSCMTILPDVEPEDGVQLEPQFVPPHVRDTVVPFLGPNDRSRAQTSAQTPRAMIDVSNITMMMSFVCCHKELVFLSTLDRQDVSDCYKTKVHACKTEVQIHTRRHCARSRAVDGMLEILVLAAIDKQYFTDGL